uniref:hypothetical protein n=1 Tax=uncultured Caballeronia sp. TaxID=1827198 RepID=UPI0035CB33B5
ANPPPHKFINPVCQIERLQFFFNWYRAGREGLSESLHADHYHNVIKSYRMLTSQGERRNIVSNTTSIQTSNDETEETA